MCIICEGNYDINMTRLNCLSCKKIKTIPILPNLQELNCWDTKITEIPVLPNLKILECYFTNIQKLPILPNLEKLYCYHTKLRIIPYLPKLQELKCSNSELKEIQYFPDLQILECCSTKIKEIPYLPKLKILYCYNTEIKDIPYLPRLEIFRNDNILIDNQKKVKEYYGIYKKLLNPYYIITNIWNNNNKNKYYVRIEKSTTHLYNKKQKVKEISKRIYDINNNYYVWVELYIKNKKYIILNKTLNAWFSLYKKSFGNPYWHLYLHEQYYPEYKIYEKIMNIKPL